jgi:hypothetical protein
MNISIADVKNIVHIGNIKSRSVNAKKGWALEYVCDKETQKKENGRIYFIIVDDEIWKIGSSECKGGIKNTFAFYEGGLSGSPSIRTFGINLLISEQINIGKTIQVYALFIEPIKIVINGLLSSIEKITYPQIKVMEDLCREDYKNAYGVYPKWNFQEKGEKWPDHIKNAYKEHVDAH